MSDHLPPGRVVGSDRDPSGAPPSPPPRSVLTFQAQRVIFCANAPLACPAGLRGYTAALSADPAYAEWASRGTVTLLRDRGYRVVSWCDCDATPAAAAIALIAQLGLDGWIGQAETSEQLHNCIQAGCHTIVGNPNAWTADERRIITAQIERGVQAIIGEMYRPDPGYSAQGVPIASFCYGIALDAGSYTPLAEYLAASPPGSIETCCVFHAAGLRDDDWRLLRG